MHDIAILILDLNLINQWTPSYMECIRDPHPAIGILVFLSQSELNILQKGVALTCRMNRLCKSRSLLGEIGSCKCDLLKAEDCKEREKKNLLHRQKKIFERQGESFRLGY